MDDEQVKKHWVGMPEFEQGSKAAFKIVAISFENEQDMELFNKTTGLKVTKKTKGVFFPIKESLKVEYVGEQ